VGLMGLRHQGLQFLWVDEGGEGMWVH
jgi:hypothetical protein